MRQLRAHQGLVVLIGVAVLLRLLALVAYPHGLYFSDSWTYIDRAFGPDHFASDRPSGYPAAMWLLGLGNAHITFVVAVQHLAGLITSVVVYLLALRIGLPRWLALVAAAFVALDGWGLALEHTILAETFFTLAVVLSAYLVIGYDRLPFVAASGFLLFVAMTMRTAGIFAVPAWLVYIAWRHGFGRRLVAGLVALVIPLAAYGVVYDHKTQGAGVGGASGWFMYGRVAQIADCSKFDPPADTRRLCQSSAQRAGHGPNFYIWDTNSPARRVYGDVGQLDSGRKLAKFSRAVIRSEPLAYAGLVVRDFVRYAIPGNKSAGNADTAITFPAQPRVAPPLWNQPTADRYLGGQRPTVQGPDGVVRAYASVVHLPRPLVALLALIGVAALLVAPWRDVPRRKEILLLTGTGVVMILGSVASSSFVLRYLVPAVPFIVCGGFAATLDLLALRQPSRSYEPVAATS